MSKNMQLTITVRPHYETDFEATYPRLARALTHVDSDLSGRNPSLYELAEKLDLLLYHSDGTALRNILLKHKDELRKVFKTTQENIADRNLAQADTLLYRIEDIFDEIESALD